MEALKIHSLGQEDYLKTLKEKYTLLINKIKGNQKLTEVEKEVEIKTLTTSFNQEKKETKDNLY